MFTACLSKVLAAGNQNFFPVFFPWYYNFELVIALCTAGATTLCVTTMIDCASCSAATTDTGEFGNI